MVPRCQAAMSKPNDLFYRAITGLVTRLSRRAVAALALSLYPRLRLALPLALFVQVAALPIKRYGR